MLTRMNLAAGFAAAFGAITGTVLTRYAQSMHMPPIGFGLLAALPFLTALVQLPASYCVERFGHRRLVAIGGILLHRALWVAIAAIPWVLPHAWWWPGLLLLLALSHSAAHAGTPALTSWSADLVPSRLRGRYFGLRGQVARLINVPLCLLLGWGMDAAQMHGMQTLLQALSLMLICAAALGVTDSLLCLALPDRWHRPQRERMRLWDMLRLPLADRNFRCFLGYTGFITLATGYVGPFVWLYLIDVVKTTNTEATVMTMVGSSAVSVLGMRYWGAVVDRWGSRRVLLIAGLYVINGAIVWALITPSHKWLGYVFVLISAFGWPGMELAGANLLYKLTETGRNGAGLGSAYAALNSTVIAIAGTLSGVFGGVVAELLRHWHGSLFGWSITFHVVLFAISGVLRIVALLFVLRMQDDRAWRLPTLPRQETPAAP